MEADIQTVTKDLVPNFLSVNQNQTALQEARDQYAQNRTGTSP